MTTTAAPRNRRIAAPAATATTSATTSATSSTTTARAAVPAASNGALLAGAPSPANERAPRARARRVRFRMLGFVFTYRPDAGEARARIDMWRENPTTGERHWITVDTCAPNRQGARRVALALIAWLRSCDVTERLDPKAQAVAESFALLKERLAMIAPQARGSVRARPLGSMEAGATAPGAAGGTRAAAA